MIYFDATFLVRLYVDESGSRQVRSLAAEQDAIASSVLGKMETEAAFHRKFREGSLDARALSEINRQLTVNTSEGVITWLSLSPYVIERVHEAFLTLPPHVYLRTGDAIHLATAAEAGFKEIYSNDRHLLAASKLFKLKGVNPLAGKS